MATVSKPKLLASDVSLTVSPGESDFNPAVSPSGGASWEVHSIIASGACDVERLFDPDESGTFESAVTVASLSGADELHGLKLEVEASSGGTNPPMAIRITNQAGSTIEVYLVGVEIS